MLFNISGFLKPHVFTTYYRYQYPERYIVTRKYILFIFIIVRHST